MASHASTLAISVARIFARRAEAVAPLATTDDLVASFGDPIDVEGFARRVLGIAPWSRQREIFEALAEWKRIGVVSGHKTGKSTALAIIALWFYCSFPNARVVITATSDRQVNGIIWREIKRLVKGSLVPIPGAAKIAIKASTGLTHPKTDSEIKGYTADKTEAIAGTSGSYVLYLVDEASGVDQGVFNAIEGNRAGGNAWVFLISNPTRADGEFYNAFHSQSEKALGKAGYRNITISSEESPNVTGEYLELDYYDRKIDALGQVIGWRKRDVMIPGMCEPGWIAEKLVAWGRDDPQWLVRVAGKFALAEEAKIFGAGLITEMVARWDPSVAKGRLYIGVDPAGDGDAGDNSGFAARRGYVVLELRAKRGISPAQHIDQILDIIATHKALGDDVTKPCVVVESEGEASWKVYKAIREWNSVHKAFELVRLRTSDRAIRQPQIYDRIRDELWAVARMWAREGGSVPKDAKLEDDLHAPEFYSDLRGRMKVTAKKDLRKLLGRSPDIGDALVMCCWEPLALRAEEAAEAAGPAEQAHDVADDLYGGGMNPYAGMNPYGDS